MLNAASKVIIGAEEWCALPELGLPAVKARIDSGAKTSSIHAFNIQTFERDGVEWVRFSVNPKQRDKHWAIHCEHILVDRRQVKSSSGIAQKRYVIRTPIQFSGQTFAIDITLANRDSMGYRMLLGREAMRGRVLIDPELKFCLGKVGPKQFSRLYATSKK